MASPRHPPRLRGDVRSFPPRVLPIWHGLANVAHHRGTTVPNRAWNLPYTVLETLGPSVSINVNRGDGRGFVLHHAYLQPMSIYV
jgi:hypothetical protein